MIKDTIKIRLSLNSKEANNRSNSKGNMINIMANSKHLISFNSSSSSNNNKRLKCKIS